MIEHTITQEDADEYRIQLLGEGGEIRGSVDLDQEDGWRLRSVNLDEVNLRMTNYGLLELASACLIAVGCDDDPWRARAFLSLHETRMKEAAVHETGPKSIQQARPPHDERGLR